MPKVAVAEEAHSSNSPLSVHELEQGIADRLKRVEEFKFIEQEAARLGVRAWLFGGTAAGYAHYVKWDMQREKGDKRFQKDRFDYDYTNIYRSTQDLDIVIDGNAEQAQKLQTALQERYPHLQGGKTAWEVRLLTQDMGDKQAILNNPDFMNQHTDSNSTGLIEITKPKAGEAVVRDVRDWKSKEPYFLRDVHDGMLHYYFSPLHESTKFAKEGRNPPILSAIRFLTKAFQYELKIRPEDLGQIKKVIQEFDVQHDTQNPYVGNWIEKNGQKLFQNAVNIEYAWNTLEQLGLRKKLVAIKNNATTQDSLAWWMNKEPLRTHPLGQGTGKTAKELGLDIVAHETDNFLAYESITRAHTGDSNVLISRSEGVGEVAGHGNGFYAKKGREGAHGTGLTIRFHLDPNAREGFDFESGPVHDYVVIKNKAALKVIPESLSVGPVELFEMLSTREISGKAPLQASDRGIFEKLKRRMAAKLQALSQNDIDKIHAILRNEITKTKTGQITPALAEWFTLPIATQYPELASALVKEGNADGWFVKTLLTKPQWRNHPEWIETLLMKGNVHSELVSHTLDHPFWQDHPEWINTFLDMDKNSFNSEIARNLLTQPQWRNHPEFVQKIIDYYVKTGNLGMELCEVLAKPHWQDHPEWVRTLIERGNVSVDSAIASTVLSEPHWAKHPELVETLIKKGTADGFILSRILSQPHWQKHTEWLDAYLERGTLDKEIVTRVLSKSHWQSQPERLEALMRKGSADEEIATFILSNSEWKNRSDWVETLIRRGSADQRLAENVLSRPHWVNHPQWSEWVKQLLIKNDPRVDAAIANHVLSLPESKGHPEWVETILKRGHADVPIMKSVLSKSHWSDRPEWIEELLRRKDTEADFAQAQVLGHLQSDVLSQPHWKQHPALLKLSGGAPPTYNNLRKGLAREDALKACVTQYLNEALK
ncbi:MAG: hypothetical protein ACJ763_19135 [Bdellovibrionia bacterium]